MFFILVSWLLLFVAIAALGSLSRSADPADESLDVFQTFWIGVGLLTSLIEVGSLFLPLNLRFQIAVLLLSLVGLPSLVRHVAASRPWGGAWGSGAITLLLALRAAGGAVTRRCVVPYDTDLYHFSSVRWMKEFAAVPGLANLHCRLGFNSAFLLFSALVDNGIWSLKSAWITSGFLHVVVTGQFVHAVVGRRQGNPRRAVLFALFSLAYLIRAVVSYGADLSYDRPALIVQMVLLFELLRFPLDRRPPSGGRVAVILVLSVLGFAIKPTGLVFMVLGVLFAGYVLLRDFSFRQFAMVTLIPALILGGYLARNAILSGWLLYPAPFGRLNLSWAMPSSPAQGREMPPDLQCVTGLYRTIKAFARVPGPGHLNAVDKGVQYWLPQWWDSNKATSEMTLFWAGTLLMVLYLIALCLKRGSPVLRELYYAAYPLLGLSFWFASAPDMRYGDAYFWMLPALALSGILSLGTFTPRTAISAAALCFVFLCALAHLDFAIRHRVWLWRTPVARGLPTREVTLKNGQDPPLVVFVPQVPEESDQCGDAPLPCTPHPRDTLMMRTPGSLGDGFYAKQNP